jgi:hypothetical protein
MEELALRVQAAEHFEKNCSVHISSIPLRVLKNLL